MKTGKIVKYLFAIVLILVIAAGAGVVITVRNKFGIEPEAFAPKDGEPVWPTSADGLGEFITSAPDESFDDRKRDYLEFIAEQRGPGILNQMVAVRLGAIDKISDEAVDHAVSELDERDDCADFDMIRVISVMYNHLNDPVLTPDQYNRLKRALLDFKYWIDEPGGGRMITWTENHQVLFHAGEYLAGQLFPADTFTNNGMNGQQRLEHAESLLRRWIEHRARWGFFEWDSNVYYLEDLAAMINIAEFCADPELAKLASMVVDLMLFDIGSDMFQGVYATTHGRTYTKYFITGRQCRLLGLTNLVWGTGQRSESSDKAAIPLALARKYRPPQAILDLPRAGMEEIASLEQHGISLDAAPRHGFDYGTLDDIIFFWGMGAYTNAPVLETSVTAFHEWNLWNHPYFGEAGFAKDIPVGPWLDPAGRIVTIESDRALLGNVNKMTYRTPDYQLSAALDYRPGGIGNQHHIWQATLGPDTIVFTTHPGAPGDKGDRSPTYWGGTNRLPRVAQHRNLLVALYRLEHDLVLGERHFYEYTHAFFPKWAFDEYEIDGNRAFGRKGDGYIALYSSAGLDETTEGRDAGVELVAHGRRAVWICQLGRRAVDGTFDEFVDAIKNSGVEVGGDLNVSFDAPGIGRVEYGWNKPFKIDNVEIPQSGFKRFDNPWCKADFDSRKYEIVNGDHKVVLDFENATRVVE